MVDVDVAPWLASLPLAPVFHPSAEEFVDPIAYILKIEREASQYGICKIIPPFCRAPEEMVLSNLNDSLTAIQDAAGPSSAHGASIPLARSMCSAVGDARVVMSKSLDSPTSTDLAKFTTRRQQLGWNPRRPRGGSQYRAQKLVWESGEYYTLDQFEEKAKSFSTSLLGTCEDFSPLVVETLFWNAESDKPISIEYANDIPGSAFVDPVESSIEDVAKAGSESESDGSSTASGGKLASSGWNIRNIARSHGSLLKCMPDEVPGVTTPMVYLGMLFSWFAWHVEDHELHSLNYLHTGARKTWYAVPSDAAPALEEVIRLYGYGSRLNSRAAFTLLGEKTTILSPEVLIAAGVPCCRLVQNPGEYVVTFPRAYHLGFSHGFNCGEAANFATPGWLEVAREAAARRASMNHLPMLSHEQLLYLFSMSLPSIPVNPILDSSTNKPSDVNKFQVEESVKTAFVNEVKQNNVLIAKLIEFGVEGCVLLRDYRNALQSSSYVEGAGSENLECQNEHVTAGSDNSHSQGGEINAQEASDVTNSSPLSGLADAGVPQNESSKPVCVESRAFSPDRYDSIGDDPRIAPLPTPWGALPCAACGILCFASMALVQPTSTATLSFRQRKQKARTSQIGLSRLTDGSPGLAVPLENPQLQTLPLSACTVEEPIDDNGDPGVLSAPGLGYAPSVLRPSSQFSGICRFNSAHDEEADAPDCDLLPEITSLSDDNVTADDELSPETASLSDNITVVDGSSQGKVTGECKGVATDKSDPAESRGSTTPRYLSSLELLAEAYKDDSEDDCDESGPQARPDGVIRFSEDEVGLSADAPWLVLGGDFDEMELEQTPKEETIHSEVDSRSLSEIFVTKGLWLGGEGSDHNNVKQLIPCRNGSEDVNITELQEVIDLRTMKADAYDEPSNNSRGPLCSFNCESNNLFPTSEQEEDASAVETDPTDTVKDADLVRDEEDFQYCASNEAPPLDAEASRSTAGSWSFSRGSARAHVFCLEHAVEAVTKLQPLGGATVLAICHSNFEVIQQKAEELAHNMKVSHGWVQIPLREASESEVEIITKAIHLKPDNTQGWTWITRLGISNQPKVKNSTSVHDAYRLQGSSCQVDMEKTAEITGIDAHCESDITMGVLDPKNERKIEDPLAEKKCIVGRWCGKQWRAGQVHPLLGGGKSSHLLGQILRRCEIGKLQKRLQPMKFHRNGIAAFPNFAKPNLIEKPLKKIRKESWDPQDRILTAAIIRKSKRNAVLTARKQVEGRRKKIKCDGIQTRLINRGGMQQTSSTLRQYGLCKQAVFSLECNSAETQQAEQCLQGPPTPSVQNYTGTGRIKQGASTDRQDCHRACQTSFSFIPTSSSMTSSASGGCQRNSSLQSDIDSTDFVKWHEVPVACSPSLRPPMQLYSEWSSGPICSTSHQDTDIHEMQTWNSNGRDLDQGVTGTSSTPTKARIGSAGAGKLVVRLKRKPENQKLVLAKKPRTECLDNSSDELDNLMEYGVESHSQNEIGLCERNALPLDVVSVHTGYTCADIDDDDALDSDEGESGSDSEECCQKEVALGSESEHSPPKAVPCFTLSRKRSSSKSRVKRATWSNLLSRLPGPERDKALQGELQTLQNQDSIPLSCVTEAECNNSWDSYVCDPYRKRLRPRSSSMQSEEFLKEAPKQEVAGKQKKPSSVKKGKAGVVQQDDIDDANNPFPCDIEGCTMSFSSEQELVQHKKNKCTFKGCGKRFFSHKYLVQHRRVHLDDRPLKCPWQGCTMSFKWAWARTEHIRVHTGERPYVCPECDKTFRFVSDFSRHKRNTGHARG